MNTDITKCANDSCNLAWKCLRHTMKANPIRQAWTRFQPYIYRHKYQCDYFIEDKK